LTRSFSPSKELVTDDLVLAALAADTVAAPAPVARAAAFGPPGDLAFVSALGVLAFSIAVEGAIFLKPLTPLADAASRAAWLMVPLNAVPAVAAGVVVAAWAVTIGTTARQASAPAAARIEERFTAPIPP
jgi:hypothetical protein